MAGLKEVRERIQSVQSTRQITSAMKMVSAAKLRRAQDAIVRMRPYAGKLREILQNLTSTLESTEGGAFSTPREVKRVLLVVVSSNRGLCGGFNSNIAKKVFSLLADEYAGKEVTIIAIGKKGAEVTKRKGLNVIGTHNEVYDNLSFEAVAPIAQRIMDGYLAGEFDHVDLIYNQFVNAAVQRTLQEQFLPVPPPAKNAKGKANTGEYIFEPGKAEIVEDLIPRSLKVQLYKAVLDSNASEHGARMTAMHKATDNATDMLKELKISYNKARQANITKEILEIVGGAAALEEG